MSALRLLVVDDEPLIRLGIRDGLTGFGGIEIVGECASGKEATMAILSQRPDLVLLDVQMPDCTGFDVVQNIGAERFPAVIFITAYDEYAVKAFEMNAVDYLLKPFTQNRLRQSLERAMARVAGQKQVSAGNRLHGLLEMRNRKWPERLAVRRGERYDLIPVESIDWIEAANNYVQLHCGSKEHLLGENLGHVENLLDPAKFLRVHRCHIVNVSRIVAVHLLLRGTFELELQSGTRLTSGRQYKDAVQQVFGV